MPFKTFTLTGIDGGSVQENKGNLRLVCLIEGGGKLAVWGSKATRKNIDTIQRTKMPCKVQCDCIPPKEWAIKYGHSFWVPEGNTPRVLP